MVKITDNIKTKIFSLANEGKPFEVCGYLAGNDNRITEIFPMTNTDKSSEHFMLDPEEQFKVIKEIRRRKLELIAVYHSHPETPARMSEEDIRLANDPGILYVICSLITNEIKSFKVKISDNKEILEEKMVVENEIL